MKDAVTGRSKLTNTIAITILLVLAISAFAFGFANAQTPVLPPSIVVSTEQPDAIDKILEATKPTEPIVTIDTILDDLLVSTVNVKEDYTYTSPKRRLSPAPNAKWKNAYGSYVRSAAKANNVPADLIMAVIAVESGFNPKARNGSSFGLMQIKLATAKGFGPKTLTTQDLLDPATNISVATKYLGTAYRMANGNICKTVSLYNQGLGSKRISTDYCRKVAKLLSYPEFKIS